MKILVVDDESVICGLLSNMLASLGHESMLMENGLEAVDHFSSNHEQIDLIITDLNMPVMDGYEAIRRIRKMSPNAMIVSMSAMPSNPPVDTIFLKKPFTLADLSAAIEFAGGAR